MPASRRLQTKTDSAAPVRRALVLQGGGALGAYEAGVLKALLEPPAIPFDIVTGCSIGAVMGAILVGSRGDPVAQLDELWQRLAMHLNPFVPGMFANTIPTPSPSNLYRINPMYYAAPPLATYMYESEPIERALDGWVDFRRLKRARAELIVLAVDIRNGRLAEFSSRKRLAPRHVAASASLPPVFPPVRVGHRDYWDGGLISNTPLRPVINAIEAREALGSGARWEIIVVDLFAPSAHLPQDMTDVVQRAFELTFFGKFQHDLKLYDMYNAQIDLMREVDRALPSRSALRRHPAFVRMSQHRRVDRLTVIRSSRPAEMGGPADFSPESIERRMKQGLADARAMRAASESRTGLPRAR